MACFRHLYCKGGTVGYQMCANLLVMRQFRHYALLALLFGSGAWLLTIPAHACVVASMPIRIQPTFSVHVYNDLGPVEGLKLKIVTLGDENPLAEATTDDKGIAVFRLQKFLWGSDLFLEPEHNVMGWQWPELYIETNATQSSIEISWPSPGSSQQDPARNNPDTRFCQSFASIPTHPCKPEYSQSGVVRGDRDSRH